MYKYRFYIFSFIGFIVLIYGGYNCRENWGLVLWTVGMGVSLLSVLLQIIIAPNYDKKNISNLKEIPKLNYEELRQEIVSSLKVSEDMRYGDYNTAGLILTSLKLFIIKKQSDLNSKKIYKFKVKDYTTILIGQRNEEEKCFFVQRGDGEIYKYEDYRIVWSELICNTNLEE